MGKVRIIPSSNFTGYPDNVKTRFRAGVEADVPFDYAKLLETKGLAERPKKTSKAFADENPDTD
jgi:hypothetical protein